MIIDGPFQETGVRQCAQTRESHVGGGFNDSLVVLMTPRELPGHCSRPSTLVLQIQIRG